MSRKSIFRTEDVEFEFGGETYTAHVQRVHIKSGAINAYRQLINGLPGMQELMADSSQLMQYQSEIESAEAAAVASGKTQQEAAAEVMSTIGKEALSFMAEFAAQQQAIEAAAADEIYQAKLDVLVPALRSWDIEDAALTLPEDDEGKKSLLQNYGALGEVVVEALWDWYRPTTASSAAGEETTPTADSTSSRSSTPAKAASAKSRQSSSTTK